MITKNALQVRRGYWSFRENGGTVGTIGLNVLLPQKSIILGFWVDTISAPTSAGAATINFGLQSEDANPQVIVGTALMLPQAFGAFVAGSVLTGNDLYIASIKTVNTDQVIMQIGTAALTGGQLAFTIMYTENQI